MKYEQIIRQTRSTTYNHSFWDYLKGSNFASDDLPHDTLFLGSGYMLPEDAGEKCEKAIADHSVLRKIGSVFRKYDGDSSVWAYDSDDVAEFIPEGGSIDIKSVAEDFTKFDIDCKKLALLLKASTEFITDSGFDLQSYVIKRLGKSFAKAEDKAFILGTGEDEPYGILHETEGAEIGVTAGSLTYDNVIDLYFSVDKDYRKNGVWLMNDKTAAVLRKLRDGNGNPLWNQATDTILGKAVVISNDMPDAEDGEKCIAFGDFSYYWLIKRSPVCVRMLRELFALNGQIGYLSTEFLDGRLVRSDAVKVLKVETEEA